MRVTISVVAGATSTDVVVDAGAGTPAVELEVALRRLARVPLGPLRLEHPLGAVADGAPAASWRDRGTVGELGLLEGHRVLLGDAAEADASAAPVLSGPAQTDRHPVELHVVSGPDAGVVVPLPMGVHELGRSGPVSWHDHSLSRRHCRVAVTPVSVAVTDLGSSNGTTVDDVVCPPHGSLPWSPGQVLGVGDSLVELRPAVPAAPGSCRPTGAGGLVWSRPPRRPGPWWQGPAALRPPDPALVARTASTPGPRLWERRRDEPDHLLLRLGTGRGGDVAALALREVAADGVLALVGPDAAVDAALRWWLLQLGVLHAPDDLALAFLSTRAGPDWAWLPRLPHLRVDGGRFRLGAPGPDRSPWSTDPLATLLDDGPAGERSGVLVLHGYADPLEHPFDDLQDLVGRARERGVPVVVTGRDALRLPTARGALVEVGARQTSYARLTTRRAPARELRLEGVGATWSQRLARCLAPLVLHATPQEPGPATAVRLHPLRWADLAAGRGLPPAAPPDSPPPRGRV